MPDRSIDRDRDRDPDNPDEDLLRIPGGCPLVADACAFVQDELPPADRERFEAHLSTCPVCRDEAAWARHAIAELNATSPAARDGTDIRPGPVPAADLVPRVLAAIEAEDPSAWTVRRAPLRRLALAAAVVLVACAGFFTVYRSSDPRAAQAGEAVESALQWLLSAQEDSGGYDAARWGGDSQFDVGLTGLSLLALLAHLPEGGSDPSGADAATAEIPGAADRAIGFLLAAQAPDGRVGPELASALYNHGIATLALLEAYGIHRDPRLREPIDRALAYVARTQSADGGWGYLGASDADPNTSVSCWPLQALVVARGLGWPGLEGAIARGFARLADVLDDRGRAGYRRPGEYPYGHFALTSMSASCVALLEDPEGFPAEARARLFEAVARQSTLAAGQDLYRDFFLAYACRRLPRSLSRQWTSAALRAIISTQVDRGANRGSWEPEDRWVSVGGRVCSTALAALILQADRRVGRLSGWLAGQDGAGGRSDGDSRDRTRTG
ncbi:MAG: zf-HC2 domain-containing protein [Planctomycetes bacterium]|nr:zf-HC2 domain-containing protein [Planctomycetota bacterium]